MEEVKTIYKIFGKFSIAIKVRVKSEGKLQNTITNKIQKIKGIEKTQISRILHS